jgi:hypothetical protein
MRIIRRANGDWGRAREIQLSDNETILKRKHDELVLAGDSRYDAWHKLYNDPSLTPVQRTIVARHRFRLFLTNNAVWH